MKELDYKIYKTKEEQIAYFNEVLNDYITTIADVKGDYSYLDCFDHSIQYRMNDKCFNLIEHQTLLDMWLDADNKLYEALQDYNHDR